MWNQRSNAAINCPRLQQPTYRDTINPQWLTKQNSLNKSLHPCLHISLPSAFKYCLVRRGNNRTWMKITAKSNDMTWQMLSVWWRFCSNCHCMKILRSDAPLHFFFLWTHTHTHISVAGHKWEFPGETHNRSFLSCDVPTLIERATTVCTHKQTHTHTNHSLSAHSSDSEIPIFKSTFRGKCNTFPLKSIQYYLIPN